MKLTRIVLGALTAILVAGAPVWAQDADQKEAVEPAADAAEAPAAEAPTYDVWWGNRSISWGNYLKFDRVTIDAMAPAPPAGPAVFDTLHFDKDKSVIRPEARAVLGDVIRMLQTNAAANAVVEIEAGAADSALARRRAEAVRNYLVENGIATERVTIVTEGEAQVTGAATAVVPISNH